VQDVTPVPALTALQGATQELDETQGEPEQLALTRLLAGIQDEPVACCGFQDERPVAPAVLPAACAPEPSSDEPQLPLQGVHDWH
jgi:hypothetical protein